MGWSKSVAADGTPRAAEPYQDADGQWCCPACGRARGFASKMAVLGHLRHCRPGAPKLDGILAPKEAPPTSNVIHLPSPGEVTTVALLSQMQAQMQALQAQQQEIGRAVGNHIQHLGAANAAAKAAPPVVQEASLWSNPWVIGGTVAAGLGMAYLASRQPLSVPYEPPRAVRPKSRKEDDHELMCDDFRRRHAAGESVTVPESCRSDYRAFPAAAPVAPRRRESVGFDLGDALATGTKVLAFAKGLKGLKL